jgi:hypothetical protein
METQHMRQHPILEGHDGLTMRAHSSPSQRRTSILVVLALLLAVLPLGALPALGDTKPWIASDKDDYAPGELVTLTGGNWQPGEEVRIVVDDDQDFTWQRDVTVTADEDGGIFDSFNLPSWFVATYTVVATGETSGTATTTFTDGNVRFLTNGPTLLGQSPGRPPLRR